MAGRTRRHPRAERRRQIAVLPMKKQETAATVREGGLAVPVIRIENLTKCYGSLTALDSVNLTVGRGQIVGLLGPNGAGKSTMMNILTGYLSSSAGRVLIDGINVLDDPMAVKSRIGYLPEQPPLYTELTPREYLKIAAGLKDVPRAERKAESLSCTSLASKP